MTFSSERFRRAFGLWLPLFALLTVASGFVDLRVRAHPEVAVAAYIPEVVAGTAAPPARYRVLSPFLTTAAADALHVSLESTFLASRLVWFLLAYVAAFWYFRTWFPASVAFGGTALLAALLPLTYTNSTMHPDHLPELALICAGCLAAVRGRDGLFGLVLLLAALNRETSAYLVAFYFFARPISRRHLARTAVFGLVWFAVFAGLRAWRGFEMYDYWQLWRNIGFLRLLPPGVDPYYRAYAYFVVLIVAGLGIVAVAHWRLYPRSIRAGLAVVPVALVVGCTLSSIIETRIFTPLLPFMLPAALAAMPGVAPATDAPDPAAAGSAPAG